jgi:5-methylcytosine-specific restriction endonuclease McrA
VIQLTRVRTTRGVPAGFRGPRRIQRARDLLTLRQAGEEPKSSVWGAAKKHLRAETDGKCAYCEGKASHVAHGDVEHFRPKSEYWWLAYCYDNFLYSCQICNQSFKGSKFPRRGQRLLEPQILANMTDAQLVNLAGTLGVEPLDAAAVQLFDAARVAEKPGIPDPYLVDPEQLFIWRADDVLREVEIRARNNTAAARRAFEAVDDCLGLNREELRLWRYETYEVAQLLADTVRSPGISDSLRTRTEGRLKRMMAVTGEFAGMVRYFVREVEGLPL